MIRAVFA